MIARRDVRDPAGACVFCRIAAGMLDRSVVDESESTIVFMDRQPLVRGHMLVAPRRHVPDLAGLDRDEASNLFEVGRRAAAAVRASALQCDGVNLLLADGEAAGQDVFHVHLHVVPRHEGDGFGFRAPPDWVVRDRSELDAACALVREAWSSA